MGQNRGDSFTSRAGNVLWNAGKLFATVVAAGFGGASARGETTNGLQCVAEVAKKGIVTEATLYGQRPGEYGPSPVKADHTACSAEFELVHDGLGEVAHGMKDSKGNFCGVVVGEGDDGKLNNLGALSKDKGGNYIVAQKMANGCEVGVTESGGIQVSKLLKGKKREAVPNDFAYGEPETSFVVFGRANSSESGRQNRGRI